MVIACMGTVPLLKWRDPDRCCEGWTDGSICLMCVLTEQVNVLQIYIFILGQFLICLLKVTYRPMKLDIFETVLYLAFCCTCYTSRYNKRLCMYVGR